jgi:hypothetical protein
MKNDRLFASLRARRVATAALLAVVGAGVVSGCSSSSGSKAAASEAKSGNDEKFCGRRSDADCDPRNRGEPCDDK